MELEPTWWIVGAGLLAAAAGPGRLARGQPEGLFVGALSAALLLLYLPWYEPADADARVGLAGGLMALAVLWFVAGAWIERAGGSDDVHTLRQRVAGHAAVAAGLAAAGLILSAAWDGRGSDLVLAAVLLPLLAAAGIAAGRPQTGMTWHGPAGVALLGLALLLPREELGVHRGAIALAQFGAAAVLLGVFLVTVLVHWRWRSAIAHENPAALARRPARHVRTYAVVGAGTLVIGVSAAWVPPGVLTPPALFLAALAALGVGHRWHSNAIGELGMLAVGAAIVTAGPAWLPGGPWAALLGLSLTGAYLLWLARFWDQQLLDGVPWTTTGRLVPIVRRLSYVTAGVAFAWAVALYMSPPAGGAPWPIAALSVLVLLVFASMLVRDAERGRAGSVPLAVLVLLAGLVPLAALAARVGWSWPPAVWPAAAGVLLTLRAAGGRDAGANSLWAAHVGGMVSLATLVLLVQQRTWSDNPTAALVAGLGAVLVGGYWMGRRRGMPTD